MTVALYARRKGWKLDATEVRLWHRAEPGQPERIEREISLTGALGPEERAKLLAIAERCPLHKTLASAVAIETRLA